MNPSVGGGRRVEETYCAQAPPLKSAVAVKSLLHPASSYATGRSECQPRSMPVAGACGAATGRCFERKLDSAAAGVAVGGLDLDAPQQSESVSSIVQAPAAEATPVREQAAALGAASSYEESDGAAAEGPQTEGDLRRISGIGPRFEAALRRQGITRLSQIAAWSEADVRQVAKALRIPKSRIVKGRWVESAREAIGNPVASE